MSGFKQFPGIPIPAFVEGMGFRDTSWNNDECATVQLVLANGEILMVWVNWDQVEMRENPHKFGVQLLKGVDDMGPATLLCTDDEGFCQRFCEGVVEQAQAELHMNVHKFLKELHK